MNSSETIKMCARLEERIAALEAEIERLRAQRDALVEAASDTFHYLEGLSLLDALKKAERRLAVIAESDAAYSSPSTLHMIRFVIAKATGAEEGAS